MTAELKREKDRLAKTKERRAKGLPILKFSDRTHCRRGHELTSDNIYTRTANDRPRGSKLECRQCRETTRRNNLIRGYGIVPKEFDSILQTQDGKCAICSKIMPKPCIDHDHETGRVRGILCVQCNATIGMAKESIEILSSAINYLITRKVN